ncbi:MAG: T9SS type A sorting domain-containing protein [Flavobacteriia bacterium]|jgi:hypothetical protein
MKKHIFLIFVGFTLLLSVSSFTSKDENCEGDRNAMDDPKAYPNPFKTKITINHSNADKIEICTLLGETIKVIPISFQDRATTLDLSELKKGVYFYVIKNDNSIIETRRIIKSE